MEQFRYLIIGGGMAAHAAVKGIREVDSDGSIGIIGAEQHPPYKRPPLSKKLWMGGDEEKIWLKTESQGVVFRLGRRAVSLSVQDRTVVDHQGVAYSYEKLLLATGVSPKRLPLELGDVIYLRGFDDYRHLRELCDHGSDFLVIGGGFIGSEMAAALATNGKKVTLVFPETGIGARGFPRELSNFLVEYYRTKGVEVLSGDVPVSGTSRHGKTSVRTQSGHEVTVDGIVAGVGAAPEVECAMEAGLPLDNGIAVDEFLCAGHSDIYAAGDAASFHNSALGRRIRVEHEDNALTMGAAAGRNMAGERQPYDYLPYFYSDMFDLGYEAVGEIDVSANQAFMDWKEPFREGTVYYLRDGRVRGVLLWNVWDKVPEARALISEPGPFTPTDLKGRISA